MINKDLREFLVTGAVILYGEFSKDNEKENVINAIVGTVWKVLEKVDANHPDYDMVRNLADEDREEVENIVRETIVNYINQTDKGLN